MWACKTPSCRAQDSKLQDIKLQGGKAGRTPVDLDIFSALRRRWPLHRIARGHLLSSPQIAVWLYKQKVRWLLIRSFPDTCNPDQPRPLTRFHPVAHFQFRHRPFPVI